jgi:2'-5' RNA ligase
VILEVHDEGRIRALNVRLLESLTGLLRTPVDGDVFLPHISVARFTAPDGLPQLQETLARLREEEDWGVPFAVNEVQLIVARLSGGTAPTFDVIRTFALSG